jgi:Uma2 family endonuclease
MTVVDERAHRILDHMEVPEGYNVELINGEIILSPSGKPLHWEIQLELIQQFGIHREWRIGAEQTVIHPNFADEPRPDFFAMPASVPVEPDGVFPADRIEFIVEVLSRNNRGTDLVDKVEVYARFGIGLYLIIDPFKGQCVSHRSPKAEGYAESSMTDFGGPVELPEPFGFAIDTSRFGRYPVKH